jgi:small subunit ribosomal protein S20
MAHHKSAIKRIKTSAKAAIQNRHYKSLFKSTLKTALTTSEKAAAEESMRKAASVLDKLVNKGIIHKNKAAHQKARIAKHVNSI